MKGRPAFSLGGEHVAAGKAKLCELPVARIPTDPLTWLRLRAKVLHGRRPGRVVWISAAVHGDELGGVEIIRRVLRELDPRLLAGTLIAVPFVNVFGAMGGSRYLPDRRDLNRSFPGSPKGSLAARLANIFLTDIVERCDFGIDLHTGSDGRTNLPQIRADLDDPETRRCAEAFAAPVMMNGKPPAGSLRATTNRQGIHSLLYEAGEALRFDEDAIEMGVAGVLRTLSALEMTPEAAPPAAERPSLEVAAATWLRARRSGLFRARTTLGARVAKGDLVGKINDPFGVASNPVRAREDGVVIGLNLNPLVGQGDALVHLGLLTGA
ncbi:MAG: succinylglutamate desuccinylase/aspartoacylase family protein [Candidatus Krumholzibacteriia bacterium]|nr:succinylglutamate desuccinylase/aspartoacylase family protein [bacterium]MCB9512978.1 succinylglutamate desuccinylase/aspartoacylase family protein [Candidatus Latescibacterota bacterium]MCB9516360.1 succinylglutamate desuccinylase/aspartoacylase family protein [Candidatus Latescibacterota bacterium]